jgi:serine/threonine protein phosphatase PrpC
MQTTLRFAVQSQVGIRPNNEDGAVAGPWLLALADGVGGHAAGDVAASLAINELSAINRQPPSRDLLDDLCEAFSRANSAIADHCAHDPQTSGMATTLTALLFSERRVALGHIGDSRAYLFRDGHLQQITRDDTLVQSLVDQGRLTPDEAWTHPQRNIVLKILAGRDDEPHLEVRETDPEDRYLICSDGLSDYVPAEEIAAVMENDDPRRWPQELVRLALQRGSQDNITCVAGEVVEGSSGYNIAIRTGAPGREAFFVTT